MRPNRVREMRRTEEFGVGKVPLLNFSPCVAWVLPQKLSKMDKKS